MATRTLVIQICDNCGQEGGEIKNREVSMGRKAYEGEICDPCWKVIEDFLGQMRRKRLPKSA